MNVYVRDISRELGRRGFMVDVFTRWQNPDLSQVNYELGENCRVIHLPAGPVKPYHKNLVHQHLPQYIEEVTAFAARDKVSYDIIHSHYWLSGKVALALRDRWDTPVIQMFHTLGHLKNQVAQRADELEPDFRIRGETEIMAKANRLVAATPLESQQMIELYGAPPENIAVIPCGVDVSLFRPISLDAARAQLGLPDGHQMILFVGRIEPLKGIDTLIRAMALVVRDFPHWQEDICVCIIGGGDSRNTNNAEMERLRRLRCELGIGNLVVFLGSRAQDSLPVHYSAAAMVVMPSHYESFGMVALEAMACGVPVIASDVGGLSFNVQDSVTGYLIPERDPEALAAKISLLLHDAALRQRLGEQATRWAQRYKWQTVADEIVELYGDVKRET